jgi:hypothetical protein
MHSKRWAKGRATRRFIALTLQVIDWMDVLPMRRPREWIFGPRVCVDFAAIDRLRVLALQ